MVFQRHIDLCWWNKQMSQISKCCTTGCLSLVITEPLSPSVLCSDRVGQVTKTYHDVKAVTHLLEEVRERHSGTGLED